jgi:isopentenyl diphosphate isomerase/L-lactate dehydrogenase-like FMN-dependent dehydrogenase
VSGAVNIGDLRRLAERRLPRVIFDYIDGGSDGELTLRENSRIFDRVMFRPRNAVATSPCNLRTTVLGTTLELPFMLAPGGGAGRSGRNRLRAVNALGMPDGGGQSRDQRSGLVSALLSGRA